MNTIQGLNRESDTFKDETRNNIGELKEENEKDTPYYNQGNKKDSNVKRIKLDLNSQYDKIMMVIEVTKTMIMDKIKLATYDLCNDIAER